MIVHIVLGQARVNLSDAEGEELQRAFGDLGHVPGVENFTFGPDFSGRSKGYDWAAVMHFRDREALQGYLDHPDHLRVVGIFNRLMPERIIVDYNPEV